MLFDLAEVQAWLDNQRKGQDLSQEVQLWQTLRGAYGDEMIGGLANVAQLLADTERKALTGCPRMSFAWCAACRSQSRSPWRPDGLAARWVRLGAPSSGVSQTPTGD